MQGTFASLTIDGRVNTLRLEGCAVGSTLTLELSPGTKAPGIRGARQTDRRVTGGASVVTLSVEAADVVVEYRRT